MLRWPVQRWKKDWIISEPRPMACFGGSSVRISGCTKIVVLAIIRSFSPRRSGFYSKVIYVGFVVHRDRFVLKHFDFQLPIIIPTVLYVHLSSWAAGKA
jgi:hypothetical protein